MPKILHYTNLALELVAAEIELLNLRITYPESFGQQPFLNSKTDENRVENETYTWTGKSVDLTEIAYSLIEDINHGKVSIIGLTNHLARMFNTQIKDCYGAYGDIKKRKEESRTYYLNELATRLNRRMDSEDQK